VPLDCSRWSWVLVKSWDGSGAVCDLGLNPRNLPVRNLQLALLRPASEGSNCAVVQFTSQPPRLVALAALLPGAPRCYPDSGNCPCDVDPTPYFSVPTASLAFSTAAMSRITPSPSLIQLTCVQQLGHLSPCDRRDEQLHVS